MWFRRYGISMSFICVRGGDLGLFALISYGLYFCSNMTMRSSLSSLMKFMTRIGWYNERLWSFGHVERMSTYFRTCGIITVA